ncbi:MAG: RNA polymerase sigma-70 factor [Cyclobacteriaceae bacterium]
MKKNDQRGFDWLFDTYHKNIYFFCTQRGISTEDAEEIVQEVFIKLWLSRSKIDPQGNVQAYIYTIAKNVLMDEFKKRIKQKAAENYQVYLLQPENETQNRVEFNETNQLFRITLNKLPEMRRIVFELSRYQGMSNKEIAQKLGISVKTVETHMTLALNNLREVFKKSEIIGTLAIFLNTGILFL